MSLRPHRASRPTAALVASLIGGALLSLTACSSGGGGSQAMTIVSCSLGCANSAGNPGTQFSCNVTDVFVNQEIRITFSAPIDPVSVDTNTFQVVEFGNGMTPPGSFEIDPNDDRVLIYRPVVTFDSSGNPIFGLNEDQTYILTIPGSRLDPLGPWIRSRTGQANQSRLRCTLVASRGIFDAKPGPPSVSVFVDVVLPGPDGMLGTADDILEQRPAANASNVSSQSNITFVFNDIMNPGTLANPVTQTSDFLEIRVDADGNVLDPSDQVDIDGTYSLILNQNALTTTVVFEPSSGLPSAGGGPTNRLIVINFGPLIADLGGNALTNGQSIFFTPEVIAFQPITVTESFNNGLREDSIRSGSEWSFGTLSTGPGGGSGRLGDLIVPSGEVVELSTDSEDFADLPIQVFNPANVIDRPDPFSVDGGVFEFSRLRIDAGGVLRFVGPNPARIYVRGEAIVQGVIDVSGTPGDLHLGAEMDGLGGVGGAGGPGGGSGGSGGLRPDGTGFEMAGGVPNPGAGPNFPGGPDYSFVNGTAGGGILHPDADDPLAEPRAGGSGGLAWPQPTSANPVLGMPLDTADIGKLEFERNFSCIVSAPGVPGGGGGYGLSGRSGIARIIPASQSTTEPPPGPGGDSAELELDLLGRHLDPHAGLLRGGSGGGGGGAHLQLTRANAIGLDPKTNCQKDINGDDAVIGEFRAHSSAGGGGGGGALQITAGRRVVLNGIVTARGGDGGSFDPNGVLLDPPALAQAGGGGSGGAVLLQSQLVQIQSIPGRIDVSGGIGGTGPFGSKGGTGGPGLIRLEGFNVPIFAQESSKVIPTDADLRQVYGQFGLLPNVLTTGAWEPAAEAPAGFSGAQSCWIQPEGNFFRLTFEDDDPEAGTLGWDMDLLFANEPAPQSYRGANDLVPGDLESFLGNDLGSAVVVRFQGARAVGTLLDPCNVPEVGIASPLVPGSLTDWVAHPRNMNGQLDPSRSPNIFRFVILWNRDDTQFKELAGGITGASEIKLTLLPD